MTLSLSASPPLRSAAPARQRGALLLASVALHAAILIPVALNTVFLPQWEPNDRTFEVWIEMPIAEPVRDRIIPRPQPVPDLQTQPVEEPRLDPAQPEQLRPEPIPEPVQQPRPLEQQTLTQQNRTQVENLNSQMPQLVPQPSPSEIFDETAPASPVSGLTGLPAVTISRPHIEAIDGPSPARDVRPLAGSASVPDVSLPSTTTDTSAAGSATDNLDAPIPRRARMTEEEEAALAAAAASGALDDAWVYRPAPGEAAGGSPAAGGAAGNTASQSGNVVFRGTPVDCTQPHMLSDLQRLSCDSAQQRRYQSSMERMGVISGTGNAERDARQQAQGDQRLNDYERRRQPLRSGVGVNQGSMLGGSERGEVLDEMSGTNREVQKLQDAMRRSNAPRPPAPMQDEPDN